MAKITIYNNPFDQRDREVFNSDDGKFIDWLTRELPTGFDIPSSIYHNGSKVDVNDYDFDLSEKSFVEIVPNIGDPVTAIGALVLTAVAYASAQYISQTFLDIPEVPTSFGINQSPTYNLRAQSNQARIGEPIPVIYGKHRVYPDLAAVPWTEYESDDQFLNQLFCIGQGEHDISDIRFGNNTIDEFEDIETEVIEPGASVTLFNDNMITATEVKRVELLAENEYVRRSTSNNFEFDKGTKSIRIVSPSGDFQLDWNLSFNIGDHVVIQDVSTGAYNGSFVVESFTTSNEEIVFADVSAWPGGVSSLSGEVVLSRYLEVHNTPNDDYSGPFVVNPSKTVTTTIWFDFEWPSGVYAVDGVDFEDETSELSIQSQEIDDDGVPLEAWQGPFDTQITSARRSPIRRSVELGVPSGRYQVRVKRKDPSDLSPEHVDTLFLVGVRSELDPIENYGQLTMFALRIKATNQLDASTSRKLNMIVERKLPTWNGSSWVAPSVTRNPAWAIADIWMSSYGGGRSFNQLDLDSLLALATIWDDRDDFFDGVFDQPLTLWEGLKKACRVGRATPVVFSADSLTVVRDQVRSSYTALFNIRNIIRGSLSIRYSFDDNAAPDGINIEYIDQSAYRQESVQPNVNSTRPRKISLFGCTSYEQAFREALYMDAGLKKQRRTIEFKTELDGNILVYGNLIAVAHPIPDWGIGGEIISVDGLELTLSEPVDFSSGGPFSVFLRREDGSVEPPIICTEVSTSENNTILLAAAPSFTIQTSLNRERTYFSFDDGTSPHMDVIVTEVIPIGGKQVKIKGVNYDPTIYDADTGIIPAKSDPVFPNPVSKPSVTGLQIGNVRGSGVVDVNWNRSFGTLDGYEVQASNDNLTWSSLDTLFSPSTISTSFDPTTLSTPILAGLVYVRVATVITPDFGGFNSGSVMMR